MSDRNFLSGVADYIIQRAKSQSQPVFVYEFAHQGEFSLYPRDLGVGHADDLQYVFEFLDWSGAFTLQADIAVRRNLLDMWITFAKQS